MVKWFIFVITFSEWILGDMFFHRHVNYCCDTSDEKLENISQVSADFHVSLHDSFTPFDGFNVHEQLIILNARYYY